MPSRLKLYCARSLNKKEELLPQLAHQQIGYEAASLKNLRWSAAEVRYEVLVSWRGFETTDNMWEPLETALENVPALVHRLLSKHPESRLVARFVVRSPCWSSRATVCWFAVASVGHFCASKRLNGGGYTWQRGMHNWEIALHVSRSWLFLLLWRSFSLWVFSPTTARVYMQYVRRYYNNLRTE
jgi:hypothetical protein